MYEMKPEYYIGIDMIDEKPKNKSLAPMRENNNLQ